MDVNIKLNKNFTTTLNQLKAEFGEEFEKINGFADNNYDLSSFVNHFIDSNNTANATIDSNANIQSKDICNLTSEIPKPYLKMLGYNKLFYEIQKKYGFQTARAALRDEWIGNLFIHNSSVISLSPYCYNYDLRDLATKGMFFIDNLKTGPAKHLSTFCDHTLELVSWVSNRQSGGTGLANVLMWFWWFWHNDVEQGHYLRSPEYYRDQSFQKFIFDCNMPYLRIDCVPVLSIFFPW